MHWWAWILVSIPVVYLAVGAALAIVVYKLNEGALPWSGAIQAVWQWPFWLLVALRLGASVGSLRVMSTPQNEEIVEIYARHKDEIDVIWGRMEGTLTFHKGACSMRNIGVSLGKNHGRRYQRQAKLRHRRQPPVAMSPACA